MVEQIAKNHTIWSHWLQLIIQLRSLREVRAEVEEPRKEKEQIELKSKKFFAEFAKKLTEIWPQFSMTHENFF